MDLLFALTVIFFGKAKSDLIGSFLIKLTTFLTSFWPETPDQQPFLL